MLASTKETGTNEITAGLFVMSVAAPQNIVIESRLNAVKSVRSPSMNRQDRSHSL